MFSHYSPIFIESKVIVQTGYVYVHMIVFEAINRITNVFPKNKNKKFCVSVDY
jgi:hypothetical protein